MEDSDFEFETETSTTSDDEDDNPSAMDTAPAPSQLNALEVSHGSEIAMRIRLVLSQEGVRSQIVEDPENSSENEGEPENNEHSDNADQPANGRQSQNEEPNNQEGARSHDPLIEQEIPQNITTEKNYGESTPKKRALDTSNDDDQICTICFESWTSSGIHRLVSLRCGHLFGRSCISKWLHGQGSRCPQCNARARKSEIRTIYTRAVKVLDTSERDQALADLDKEQILRKQAEMKYTQMNLKFKMVSQENERLKKELMEKQLIINEIRRNAALSDHKNYQAPSKSCSFTLIKMLEVNKSGGCRVMENCGMIGTMVITQPSTNPLFPGFGLKKISFPEIKPLEFLHLHQKAIKDVSFHVFDTLVLTASIDKTVKLTNVLTNSVVQTYTLDCDVWSCAWDMDDSNYFYAGVRTGSVFVFDIRNTEQHVSELRSMVERSPVASLQYLRRQSNAKHSKCGPIVGQLNHCTYFEKQCSGSYEAHVLPLEGNFTSLSCDSETSHLLASFRPSQKHSNVTHTLCELSFEQNAFSCNFVQSILGGKRQAHLSRSKLFSHFGKHNSFFVCAGDEEAKAALVWDGGSGELQESLTTESHVVDLLAIKGEKSILGTLTETSLRFYEYSSR